MNRDGAAPNSLRRPAACRGDGSRGRFRGCGSSYFRPSAPSGDEGGVRPVTMPAPRRIDGGRGRFWGHGNLKPRPSGPLAGGREDGRVVVMGVCGQRANLNAHVCQNSLVAAGRQLGLSGCLGRRGPHPPALARAQGRAGPCPYNPDSRLHCY